VSEDRGPPTTHAGPLTLTSHLAARKPVEYPCRAARQTRLAALVVATAPGRDWRKTNPRFTGENFQHNLRIADEIEAVAAQAGATPAQVALAWLLAKGDDIATIPGTKRVSRVEENSAADGIELTAEQISKLNNLTPAAGNHHEEADMRLLGR